MGSPRAACGVTPQGAALAARRGRFRGALELGTCAGKLLGMPDAVFACLLSAASSGATWF